MNYEEALSWIDDFHQFGIQLGLNRIENVLDSLNKPHKKIDFVHVAGTNGKGSVCRYISSILSSEGYKTGLYLSPHLVDFRERFQLDNEYISKQRFVDIVTQVKPVIEQMMAYGFQLTYFEVCTLIAFVFFADENVDYAIVEVGLGGRYDATNVIMPLVSVITNISLDH
ncbi:MAG: bifunctional folylpolyglutamate synthase/dihydrofolate synthase, partial [Candidatus Thermoplasmatota archaeon]|nr:bifunctional folylpolyglutamate synthase/dihydrofolate synthase [Candidatus Thermoplasmatota archaeon]